VAALVARDIRGNPILGFRQRSVYAANRPAALPMSLLDRIKGKDAQSQLVRCLQFLAPLSRPGVITLNEG